MLTDSLIGRTIKDFVIRERIGRGGMAVVYRATQTSIQRDVALKVIQLNNENYDEHFRERFRQEAELIAHLEHIHILPIYDYGVEADMAFIAMRLLKGGTLRELVHHKGLPLDRSADLFNQIGAGLAYAHKHGVIHRDLKPGNILLDDVGNAFIADFGLAKLVESSLDLTDDDNLIGTPHYMAPEQIRGEHGTTRSDVYSLGILLYEMLTGSLPFDNRRRSVVSSMYQSLEETPIPVRQLNNEIPVDVERVLMHAIEKRPENRYPSVDAMTDELNLALGRTPGSKVFSRPTEDLTDITPRSRLRLDTKPVTSPSSRRAILIPVLVTIFIIVIAGLIGFWITSRNNDDDELHISPPTVLIGEASFATEIVPGEATLEKAQFALGDSGFIGVISCNLSSEYHATLAREITDFARDYGLPVTVYDSNNDSYLQVTLIERARAEGSKALIICPLDNEMLAETLTSAEEAGIPMVFMHGDMPSYGGVRMFTDNYLLGKVPGIYAGELVNRELGGDAEVIILDYPDIDDVVIRANGLEDGIKSVAARIQIVGRYLGGTRDNGYASVKALLDEGVHFDVILSINDAGSYGAVTALEEAGFKGEDVIIVSVDAENLARQYIQYGHFIRASVPVGRTEAARAAVDGIVQLLAGGTVPENILIEPGPLVTKDTTAQGRQ